MQTADSMGIFAAPIGTNPAPIRAQAAPAGAIPRAFPSDELALGHDLSSPKGARAYCEALVARTVMAAQADAGTKDAAIHSIARRYRLGSFVRKLWKGEACSLHLDKVIRLQRAHDDAVRSLRERF